MALADLDLRPESRSEIERGRDGGREREGRRERVRERESEGERRGPKSRVQIDGLYIRAKKGREGRGRRVVWGCLECGRGCERA